MATFRIQHDTVEHYEEVVIVRAETEEEAVRIANEFLDAYDGKLPQDPRVDYMGKTCIDVPYFEEWVTRED